MVFGEIIVPSTRALIIEDEDLENIPIYIGPVYQWEGQARVPDNIETLIIVESKKAVYIASFLIRQKQPVASILNEGVSIYKVDNNYIVLFLNTNKNLVLSEIAEILSPWLKKAKSIQAITTELISSLKPTEIYKDMITTTKYLTNYEVMPFNFGSKLGIPNLVQGLGASILSYCIHNNLKAILWIVYTDHMPPDSANTSELTKYFNMLKFDFLVDFKNLSLDNNLYM